MNCTSHDSLTRKILFLKTSLISEIKKIVSESMCSLLSRTCLISDLVLGGPIIRDNGMHLSLRA